MQSNANIWSEKKKTNIIKKHTSQATSENQIQNPHLYVVKIGCSNRPPFWRSQILAGAMGL